MKTSVHPTAFGGVVIALHADKYNCDMTSFKGVVYDAACASWLVMFRAPSDGQNMYLRETPVSPCVRMLYTKDRVDEILYGGGA